jgi:hypothetical protein
MVAPAKGVVANRSVGLYGSERQAGSELSCRRLRRLVTWIFCHVAATESGRLWATGDEWDFQRPQFAVNFGAFRSQRTWCRACRTTSKTWRHGLLQNAGCLRGATSYAPRQRKSSVLVVIRIAPSPRRIVLRVGRSYCFSVETATSAKASCGVQALKPAVGGAVRWLTRCMHTCIMAIAVEVRAGQVPQTKASSRRNRQEFRQNALSCTTCITRIGLNEL